MNSEFEIVKEAMREVYHSASTQTQRTSDGSAIKAHKFDSKKVEELLDTLERVFPGVQEEAMKPSEDQVQQIMKEWQRLIMLDGKREHQRFRIKQLAAFLDNYFQGEFFQNFEN